MSKSKPRKLAWPTPKGIWMVLKTFLSDDADRFLWRVPGVIHVGANSGQERIQYAKKLLSVVWVEPLPQAFAELQANIIPFQGQRAIRALVSGEDGQKLTLNVSIGSGAASSILPLKEVHAIWPDVRYESQIEMESVTLPTLLASRGISPRDYPALVLDTQGSELFILRGAAEILRQFAYIKIEVPDFESYEGCCTVSEVQGFLGKHGFVEASRNHFASDGGKRNYYDIVFRNKNFRSFFPLRIPLRRPQHKNPS